MKMKIYEIAGKKYAVIGEELYERNPQVARQAGKHP
jgi:hypothetical protein